MSETIDVLIKQQELFYSSPERVFDWFKKRSEAKYDMEYVLGQEFELSLLKRNEKLIELAIAKYGVQIESLSIIFEKALKENNEVLACACLSNEVYGQVDYGHSAMPFALFGFGNKDELKNKCLAWFNNITKNQVRTLFKNKTISNGSFFLQDYLDGNEFWQVISDELRIISIVALSKNTRMKNEYSGLLDGYAEYKYDGVFYSAWNLSKTAPVCELWALVLGGLYHYILDIRGNEFDSLKIAKRWMVEDKDNCEKKHRFDPFVTIRAGIYRNIIKSQSKEYCYTHSDIAYRAISYKETDISIEEMKKAYDKDAIVAIDYLLDNLFIWKDKDKRGSLLDLCFNADGQYNNSYMDFVNCYEEKEKKVSKDYPAWFTDVDESNLPLTIEDIKCTLQDFTCAISAEMQTKIFSVKEYNEKNMKFIKNIFIVVIIFLIYFLIK